MSLYNQQVSNVPLSLDGLYTGTFTDLTINGVEVDPNAPNLPINPSSTNATYAPVFTNTFGYQQSAQLLVDADFGLTFNPGTNTLGTTNLYTNGTVYTGGLSVGTPAYAIGLNSSGYLVKYTASSSIPSQIYATGTSGSASLFYPSFFITDASGNQTVYVDTTAGTISYQPSTKTLTVQNLAGNAASATKVYTTQTAVSSSYYFSFVPANTAGNQDHYVAYPGTFGQDSYYSTGASLGDPGTFYFQRVNVAAAIQLPQDTTFPLISPGTAAFSLGIDSSNRIIKFTPGAPTITATTTNTGYYLAMCASNMTGAQPLYVDGNAYITYNPSTYRLSVPNLTVSIGASIAAAVLTGTPTAPTAASGTNTTQIATTAFVQTTISGYAPIASPAFTGTPTAPTAGSGTNTTQIATCQFVQTALGTVSGFLPLTGGIMSGTIGFSVGTNNLLSVYYSKFNQYVNSITDTAGNAYIQFLTDAPNASPSPLVGGIVLQRATTILSGGTTRLEVNSTRVKVSTVELAVSSQTAGQIRMIWSETGYGAFWRNDNANFYLLLTANGDPYGSWNGLRPFYINVVSGRLYSDNGQTFSGGTDTPFITFQNGLGLTTAAGASYGNVSVYGTGINSWNGYDLNKRWTLMANDSASTCGLHDKNYTWQWRVVDNTYYLTCPTIIFQTTPQQSYQPYQVLIGSNGNSLQWGVIYSSFYKNNNVSWNSGIAIAYFYKASATSVLRCSGAGSYYITGAGGYNTAVNFYNTDTTVAYILNFTQFTNNAYNHVSFPIMAQYAGLPVGNYAIIVSTNGITDGNDHLYLLSEICFG